MSLYEFTPYILWEEGDKLLSSTKMYILKKCVSTNWFALKQNIKEWWPYNIPKIGKLIHASDALESFKYIKTKTMIEGVKAIWVVIVELPDC